MSAAVRRDRGAVPVGLLVAIGLLVVGVVVAVLGVQAAASSMQDRDDLADYADARAEAQQRLDAGNQAVALGQELCNCDTQQRDLANQQVAAFMANDADTVNSLTDQLNTLSSQWNDLASQLDTLLAGQE